MSNSPFDPNKPLFPWYQPPITLRPKIFFSYQHATDQYYYNEFSRIFHDTHECVYDNSLDDAIDSDDDDYIKQRIRDEFITGTSCTVVLVGPATFQRKHVDWEIKATLDKQHGLIGVQLPNLLQQMRRRLRAVSNHVSNMGTIHVPIKHTLVLGAGKHLFVRYAGKRIPLWRLFGSNPDISGEGGLETYHYGENLS